MRFCVACAVLASFQHCFVEVLEVSLEIRYFVELELRLQIIGGVLEQHVRLLVKRTEHRERNVPGTELLLPEMIVHSLQGVDDFIDSILSLVLIREKNAL